MRITSGGEIGIGITPKSWTLFNPIQIGQSSSFVGRTALNQTDVANNWYYNGNSRRINAGYAQRYIQNSSGEHVWYTAGTDSADSILVMPERLRIANGGDIITSGNLYRSGGITTIGIGAEFEFVDATASVTKRFRPGVDNSFDLGDSSRRWDDVWATNPAIQTSDINEKNTIKETDLGLDFINKLKPVSYIWNNKTRTHYGLIAQDVEDLLSEINKDTKDFAGFIKADVSEEKDNSKHSYGLRYNEFISPMIKAIQELKADNDSLKARIETLENK